MKQITKAVVLKVGTSTLASEDGFDAESFERIGRQIDKLRLRGYGVLLVTSAARRLQLHTDPWGYTLGQWRQAISFNSQGYLLTDAELETANGCRSIIDRACIGCVAIINTDDDLLTEDSAYTSNDIVAARIAQEMARRAKTELGILSDVNGLLSDINNPDSVIPTVHNVRSYEHLAGNTQNAWAKGGMVTKLIAAGMAQDAGARSWITHGCTPDTIELAMRGIIGTRFECPANDLAVAR
jgi:glutamate 5-kinase